MRPESKKEDAVSPVVGVMLMLVVTIIIAAVVAALAGGFATDTETTPNAIFEVTYANVTTGAWGGSLYDTYFLQKGGDAIKIEDISVKIGRDEFTKLGSISPTTMSGSSLIHTGDILQVNMDGYISSLYSGDALEWQVIYKKTGNIIASGIFTV